MNPLETAILKKQKIFVNNNVLEKMSISYEFSKELHGSSYIILSFMYCMYIVLL